MLTVLINATFMAKFNSKIWYKINCKLAAFWSNPYIQPWTSYEYIQFNLKEKRNYIRRD